ncbi:cilia- and flagella-associated protein 418-like isoform X2 [Amblyomma americanum]
MCMEDDIDILLDDVEAKFCKRTGQTMSTSAVGASSDDSIEHAINEICRAPELSVPNSVPAENKLLSRKTAQCFVVYLAGTDVVFGVSTSASKRACSHIHCCRLASLLLPVPVAFRGRTYVCTAREAPLDMCSALVNTSTIPHMKARDLKRCPRPRTVLRCWRRHRQK